MCEVLRFKLAVVGLIDMSAQYAESDHVLQFGLGTSTSAVRSVPPLLDGRRVRFGSHRFRDASCRLSFMARASSEFDPACAVVAILHGHPVIKALAVGIAAFPAMPSEIAVVSVAHRFLQRIDLRHRNFQFLGDFWMSRY
ncbi:MAG TPA: hypothetical protein VEF34_13835 [Syntrophobacteraceae bacterium]|nr:hypothetical protein [Syntrophobacteraceae bacterium]